MRADKFVSRHPWCCFCGGTQPARSIDHQPPRIWFPDKHRPKGLEFPACEVCNAQTSADEALVGLVARFTGGHRPEIKCKDKGLDRAADAVISAFPDLGRRIVKREWISFNSVYQQRVTFDAGDAQVTRSMCRVAAKLALAAYYARHQKACPASVKINTQFVHNQRRSTALAIGEVLRKVNTTLVLKQGAWNTEGSFFLRYHTADNGFASIAVLHESLALMAMINRADETKDWIPWAHVWKPAAGEGIVLF